MGRFVLRVSALLAISATIIFGLLWLERLRYDYNSEGRYFDADAMVVYDEGGVMFYGLLTLVSLVLFLLLAKPAFRR